VCVQRVVFEWGGDLGQREAAHRVRGKAARVVHSKPPLYKASVKRERAYGGNDY